ncbi:uncharacterized protein LOC124142185 [Haliotis rufescens]|uniref:uncharacterized protein LOC124142185 n=1 Tax=Haliotis rufescens TaxID=6454 RepID=UPI001EB0786B|nr:uncharacterized protein LOC124142185 [Haliotis rufescens]
MRCITLFFSAAWVLGIVSSQNIALSSSGMTVLKAVYGASCGTGRALADEESLLTDYVKALCDGRDVCSGVVDVDVLNGAIGSCDGDFHVVAVCDHGELRSYSLDGEAAGEEFTIDCRNREIPVARQHPDWMGNMGDVLVNKTIKQLRLAGTHHSGTFSFNMFLYHLAKCQNVRVGQQLMAGVRYVDYRLGAMEEAYGARVIHGVFYGQLVLADLLEIWAFSQLHPREFFIVDFQHTSTLEMSMQRQLSVWLDVLFRDTVINRWTILLTEHTMGDVWGSGRRVLFLHDRPTSTQVWPRGVIYARWPNVCTGETLDEHSENELSQIHVHHHQLVILQWVITVQFQCLTSLYGRSLDIREEGMLWLQQQNHPFTIVLTDFTLQPLEEAGLVEQIIEANRHVDA